jgi:hypothetical protein
MAKTNEPADWTILATAAASLQISSVDAHQRPTTYYQVLGFVFADGDGMVGVDLDGCIDEERRIAPWAQECLRLLPTEKCARLVGGMMEFNDSQLSDARESQVRLLSSAGRMKRLAIIDNLKTLRFSSSFFESMIAAAEISGRQLFEGEGTRPNSLTWAITCNGASLSRDAAQRCIVVKLARPVQTGGAWDDAIDRFIEAFHSQIIGDIAAEFNRPATPVNGNSRWGLWRREIVGRLKNPEEVMAEIARRAESVDDDESEKQIVRDGFTRIIYGYGHDPETVIVDFTAQQVARSLREATAEVRSTVRSASYIKTLGIGELTRHRTTAERLHRWTGCRAEADTMPVRLAY